jgi:hypothetical protein
LREEFYIQLLVHTFHINGQQIVMKCWKHIANTLLLFAGWPKSTHNNNKIEECNKYDLTAHPFIMMIGPDGLLLVVPHVFAVPVSPSS